MGKLRDSQLLPPPGSEHHGRHLRHHCRRHHCGHSWGRARAHQRNWPFCEVGVERDQMLPRVNHGIDKDYSPRLIESLSTSHP